jgi:hypothetical protein
MKIYHYDRETGIYIGETYASIDPLETEKQGEPIYLCPACATFDTPPQVQEGKYLKRDAGKWLQENIPTPPEPEKIPEPTAEEIAAVELEHKIQAELRAMAIERLQVKGKISA